MRFLTILTPTYNRSKLLKNVYESLLIQQDTDFIWMVIDDGSDDCTEKIMKDIIKNHEYDESFLIEYHKKKNGGKHTALNYSHKYLSTKYVCVLDSDDTFFEESIKQIKESIESYKELDDSIGWFAFLRGNITGGFLDVPYQTNNEKITYVEYLNRGRKGECVDVYLSTCFKQFPYPEIDNEKFVSESYLNIRAALYGKFKMVTINKIVQKSSYLSGGLTDQGRLLQLKSPYGNSLLWKTVSNNKFNFKIRLKAMLLYQTYSLFAHRPLSKVLDQEGNIMIRLMVLPVSVLLFNFWKYQYKL